MNVLQVFKMDLCVLGSMDCPSQTQQTDKNDDRTRNS